MQTGGMRSTAISWLGGGIIVFGALAPCVAEEEERLYQQPITVFGVARDEEKNPIANADVYLLSTLHDDFRRVAETTTNEKGEYRFEDVKLPMVRPAPNSKGRDRGVFEVLGVADGFGFSWRPQKWCWRKKDGKLAILAGREQPGIFFAEDPIELDLTFPKPATLGGQVINERGNPVQGVRLQLRYCAKIYGDHLIAKGVVSSAEISELVAMNQPEDVPVDVKVRTTDETGGFEFTGLPPDGLFRIDVRHPEHAAIDLWMATSDRELPKLGGKTEIHLEDVLLTLRKVYPAKLRVVYEDTEEPAAGVYVSASANRVFEWKTSDEQGEATLQLPTGDYQVQILPLTGTPYLITEIDDGLFVSEMPDNPTVVRLRRACVVEVTIVDGETGEGIPDVDLWIDQPGNDFYFRSWKPPRLSNVERPVTDSNGKLTALLEPGEWRLGAGNQKFPKEYRPDTTGQALDCDAGKTLQLRIELSHRPAE
jgi:protocatechuate 3,4-dioxygenase beta subunit